MKIKKHQFEYIFFCDDCREITESTSFGDDICETCGEIMWAIKPGMREDVRREYEECRAAFDRFRKPGSVVPKESGCVA